MRQKPKAQVFCLHKSKGQSRQDSLAVKALAVGSHGPNVPAASQSSHLASLNISSFKMGKKDSRAGEDLESPGLKSVF